MRKITAWTLAVLIGLPLQFITMATVIAADLDEALWQDIKTGGNPEVAEKTASQVDDHSGLLRFRQLGFDEARFRQQLESFQVNGEAARKKAAFTMRIPLPDGTSERVRLVPNEVMPPELMRRYPAIRTWTVEGVDNPAVRGRADVTHYGFHAMLLLEDGQTVFVERDTPGKSGIYNAFSTSDNQSLFSKKFQCDVPGHDHSDASSDHLADPAVEQKVAARQALPLITYRLAIAATGEYTQYHGGSVANALSAIVTTINRVNEINERDIGVRFQLIADADRIIYTNPFSDPYSNGDATAMLEENMLNLSGLGTLDESAFDVGHVFGQGPPAGFAFVGSACDFTFKAGGVTASPNPKGDAFDVDFVAHELGHQLGATHTFNSETLSCGGGNRTPESAVEPGSGSTLMAYAGICGTNDLQSNSDAMYHALSIQQINGFTRNSTSMGSSCGARVAVSNEAPLADAGADAIIPAKTPFLLEGAGSDVDNDALSFAWDQQDAGAISSVNVDTGDNAIIRSLLPGASAKRFVPSLDTLFGAAPIKGEILPQTQRKLNFSLTARDGKGGVGTDSMTLDVRPLTRSFEVTSHTFPQSFIRGQTTTVTWNVANTSVAPFNCSRVDIGLLAPSGLHVLLETTDNDGNAGIRMPDDVSSMARARLMVKCSNSPFFNVSTADLEILGESDTVPPTIELLGFNPVKVLLGATYVDAGATATDDFDPSVTINRTGTVNTAVAGTYVLVYTAIDDAGNSASVTRIVNVVEQEEQVTTPPIVGGGGGGGAIPLFWLTGFVMLAAWRRTVRMSVCQVGGK